jgi:SSU ribosomal protein S15P
MARMHTRRRGSSGSDKPAAEDPPAWSDVAVADIEARIIDLAEQGLSTAAIGLRLRDEGVKGTPVPDVRLATGRKITAILAEHDAAPAVPEDLQNLMERALRLHAHMEQNRQDMQNKRALQNTEAKIRRLVNYYRGDALDADFRYSAGAARRLLGE